MKSNLKIGICKNVGRFKNNECPTFKNPPCNSISNTVVSNIFKFIFVNCYLCYGLLINLWCSTYVKIKNTLYSVKYL